MSRNYWSFFSYDEQGGPAVSDRVDVLKEIKIHVVRLDDGAWAHTHGMEKFGKAELEIKGIPLFLASLTGMILNQTCDYMLNSGKPVLVNEVIKIGSSTFRLVESEPEAAHYDGHYDHARWELVDPDSFSYSFCDSCKKGSDSILN